MGPPPSERSRRGSAAESFVAAALEQSGWRILHRNLRTPLGEVDILARSPDQPPFLVAVEVKARHPLAWDAGEEALRPAQRRRLARALEWFARRTGWNGDLRLDLVRVVWDEGRAEALEHLPGVAVD
ncbi:MAG TPA: YraN family protein [Planctomycetota bacterium]